MSFCAGQPQIRPAWARGFVGTRVGRRGDSPFRPVLRLPERQLASRLVAKKKSFYQQLNKETIITPCSAL